jgi:virginiamycin B lyase
MCRVHVALTALVVFLAAATGRAAAAEPTPIELPQGTRAQALAFGPDGRLWFTASKYGVQEDTDVVGSTSLSGERREYALPARTLTTIGGIVSGSDGSLWFADTARSAIGRVTLGGTVTETPLTPGATPQAVAVGPDGAVWFTETEADRVGRIDPNGEVATFPLPSGAEPAGLASGSDGALWIAEHGISRIARLTPDGGLTEFPLGLPKAMPTAVTRAAGGDIWFGEEGANRVGRIDRAGHIAEFAVPGDTRGLGGGTGALAAAPDGGVYFVTGTQIAQNEVGSISSHGVVTGIGCLDPTCALPVNALTVGPEGRLWYATGQRYVGGGGSTGIAETYYGHGTIGSFDPPAPVRVRIPLHRFAVRGGRAKLAVECRGAGGAACRGVIRLQGRFKLPGWRHRSEAIVGWRSFSVPAQATHRVAVRITSYGLRLLRLGHGKLHLLATASIHGGFGTSEKVVLLRH